MKLLLTILVIYVVLPEDIKSTSEGENKPHKQELELLENFKDFYKYKDIIKMLPTIKTNTDLVLEDGTKAHFILSISEKFI